MELGENDLQPQNTALVRKRVREPKRSQKPGRKRPRPGDISLETLEQGDPEQDDMEPRMEQQDMEQYMEQEDLEQCMEQIDMERNMEQANTEQRMEQQEDMERYKQQEALEQRVEQEKQNMKQQEEQNWNRQSKMKLQLKMKKIRQLSDLLKEMSADKTILSQFLKQNEISFDKVITSTPKFDLKRDIRYSLEVWIAADKNKLFHNLNMNEKRIMQSKQWLNDIIIDSVMNLLTYQFPDLEGFQSCQLAHQLDFDIHE